MQISTWADICCVVVVFWEQLIWRGVFWLESLVGEGRGGRVSVNSRYKGPDYGAFMKDYIGTKQWAWKGSIVKKQNLSFYACKTYSYMT